MTVTEVRPRPSPKVDWRIAIPIAPEGPPTISANAKRRSALTHWFLTILVTALLAVRFSAPFSLGGDILAYYGKGAGSMVFWAVVGGTIFFFLSYWIVRVGIFQNLPYIRRARKIYEAAIAEHNKIVHAICEEAAAPIRELWFPLCKYGEARRQFADAMIWWRTGDKANNFAVQDFRSVRYTAGSERLVRFTKCHYTPDPNKPGTAEFNWGSEAILQDPDLL